MDRDARSELTGTEVTTRWMRMREAIAPRPGFAWPVYVGALLAILVFPFVWLYHKVTGR